MASLITTEKAYSEAIAASHLAVLHFLADWAPECATVTAVLAELSKDPGLAKVKFFQLEAEKMPEISMKHEIVAVPTVLMFRNSKAVDRFNIPIDIRKISIKNCTSGLMESTQRS